MFKPVTISLKYQHHKLKYYHCNSQPLEDVTLPRVKNVYCVCLLFCLYIYIYIFIYVIVGCFIVSAIIFVIQITVCLSLYDFFSFFGNRREISSQLMKNSLTQVNLTLIVLSNCNKVCLTTYWFDFSVFMYLISGYMVPYFMYLFRNTEFKKYSPVVYGEFVEFVDGEFDLDPMFPLQTIKLDETSIEGVRNILNKLVILSFLYVFSLRFKSLLFLTLF